jgi:uncharacterized beta-barrel protein YwiB (DUF1934 family)
MQTTPKSWSTIVTLTTQITQDTSHEEFSFEEVGILTRTQNALYIRYTEHQQNLETPVTFKISQIDDVLLHRHNDFTDMQLHFVPNKTFQTQYVTSQGNIPIAIRTDSFVNQITADHPYGQLAITYSLLNNDSIIGTYALNLSIAKAN